MDSGRRAVGLAALCNQFLELAFNAGSLRGFHWRVFKIRLQCGVRGEKQFWWWGRHKIIPSKKGLKQNWYIISWWVKQSRRVRGRIKSTRYEVPSDGDKSWIINYEMGPTRSIWMGGWKRFIWTWLGEVQWIKNIFKTRFINISAENFNLLLKCRICLRYFLF